MTVEPNAVSLVERTLAELWQRKRIPAGETPSDPGARVAEVARLFGERAMDCVSATIREDRSALVRESADLVELLFAIWGEIGLDPREVWVELHKREQLGTLLMQLNQAHNQLPRRVLKPWRVDSTKLP